MVKLLKKLLGWSLFLSLLAVGFLIFQMLTFLEQPILIDGDEPVVFEIPQGSNITQVAQRLSLDKHIDSPWLFVLLAKLENAETRIKAGEYYLSAEQTPGELLDAFVRGNSIQYSFTVIEGWTFRQMLTELWRSDLITNTLEAKSDAEIMAALGYPDLHPEGRFFPDTYRFPRQTTDLEFLQRAFQTMETELQEAWDSRSEDLPLESPYEALILASIIEKETGAAFERPMIAGVFTERLRRGMKLQTDPTIIYGMGDEFDGDIRFRDLRRDTPYNTYIHKGLTPTPIALPGRESLDAALNPEKTKALFFVSKGDGTHQFSETYEEHNKAVRRYQLNKGS